MHLYFILFAFKMQLNVTSYYVIWTSIRLQKLPILNVRNIVEILLLLQNKYFAYIIAYLINKHSKVFSFIYDLRGSRSWESVKSPINDRRFSYRRNFWNEQAPSAEVIYNDTVHTQRSTVASAGKQIQRYYLRVFSNNSSQIQQFNLPVSLIDVRVENDHSLKQVELRMQNSQFRQWFWNILEDLACY